MINRRNHGASHPLYAAFLARCLVLARMRWDPCAFRNFSPRFHLPGFKIPFSTQLIEVIAMIYTCASCGLRQFVLNSDLCRRCRAPLGSSTFEISLIKISQGVRRPNQLSLPFGSALRSMRLRQGLTESQIAQCSCVERSHLSRIERNLLTPNLQTVLRILRGLGAESIVVCMRRN